MRIALTGAAGYLGRAVARRLSETGHELRALVRPGTPAERRAPLETTGAAVFEGDVTDRASLREALSGADWVIHAAALLDLGRSPAEMARVNIDGSENVASLAFKLGVGGLLSISSIAYFGGSPDDGSLATEASAPRLPFPTAYSETKHRGERAIQQWAKRGLAVRTVYPALIYGPPGKKDGANFLLRALMLGRFPVLLGGDRKTSWVHLDDVVEAIARVLEAGADGRGYLLAGEVVETRELVRQVERLTGTPGPRRELPIGLAKLALRLAAPLYRLRGRRSPLPAAQLDSLSRQWAFDDRRAQGELGWRPRSLEEGLPPTLAYLRNLERR